MLHCRIIEPLTSRCSKFRFKPLAHDILTTRLKHIAQQENVSCQPVVRNSCGGCYGNTCTDVDTFPQVLERIVNASEGDLRKV